MSRHILFLGFLPPTRGGTQRAMALFVNAIADAGYRVTAISPIPPAMAAEVDDGRDFSTATVVRFEMPPVISFLGYRDAVMPVGLDFRQYYGLQAERALPILCQIIDRDPPDLIVLGHESFLCEIVAPLRSKGLPIVLFSHGPLAAIANGRVNDEFVGPLLDLARQVDLVLPVSDHTTKWIGNHGIEACTVRSIVEIDRFSPQPKPRHLLERLGLDASDVVVSHASIIRLVKRPLDLVESAALTLREEPRLVYLVIGDGPLREDMERRCHELRIAGRFRFTGWIRYGDVDPYLNVADIAVLASGSEAMPYAALEPMSCERTVVASDLPWTREVLQEGQSMLLFPVADVPALARLTLQAAADAQLRARMGAEGRKYVTRHHRKECVVAGFAAAVKPLMPPTPG